MVVCNQEVMCNCISPTFIDRFRRLADDHYHLNFNRYEVVFGSNKAIKPFFGLKEDSAKCKKFEKEVHILIMVRQFIGKACMKDHGNWICYIIMIYMETDCNVLEEQKGVWDSLRETCKHANCMLISHFLFTAVLSSASIMMGNLRLTKFFFRC